MVLVDPKPVLGGLLHLHVLNLIAALRRGVITVHPFSPIGRRAARVGDAVGGSVVHRRMARELAESVAAECSGVSIWRVEKRNVCLGVIRQGQRRETVLI